MVAAPGADGRYSAHLLPSPMSLSVAPLAAASSTVLSDVSLVADNALHDSGAARPAHAITCPEGRSHDRSAWHRRARSLLARLAVFATGESRTASHQLIIIRRDLVAIGENDPKVRAAICGGLSWADVRLDQARNRAAANPISDPASRCAVRFLPRRKTNRSPSIQGDCSISESYPDTGCPPNESS
jgi:hypothetical protein